MLINPRYDEQFFIRCCASSEGLGAVLYQKDSDGNEQRQGHEFSVITDHASLKWLGVEFEASKA